MATSMGTALVTGASSGIGAVYARRLARRGHDLILVARDRLRLEAAAEQIAAEYSVAVEVLVADLAATDGLEAVAARIEADPALSLLVNAAGLGPAGPALATPPQGYDAMLTLNVGALQRLTLTAAQVFAGRGRGTIINLASVVALIPERMNAPYVAGKAFVLELTRALAAELAGSGVRFQAVLPGLTRTEIFDRAGGSLDHFPAHMVMEAGDMVDAALAGLDAGELVTIPSLPDAADWAAYDAARARLAPNLSHDRPAARYLAPPPA
ncbi:SDR family NAD(P)-dependent oxidoreductase [Tistrella mobilis]|uniref:SDR family NAD(P)-dependent oxidoreductase n=1 Tax=Tistrella mobilis TaxID=171437 RepID=UPI0031F6E318